jgi:hypothetical protein
VRQSLLIAAAKARVWASEGWEVVVTDGEEKTLDPADFEKLFEIKEVSTLTFAGLAYMAPEQTGPLETAAGASPSSHNPRE